MEGVGTSERSMFSTIVHDNQYTVFLRRVYGATTPSINQLFIVPGDGAGIQHYSSDNTFEDIHGINYIEDVDHFFYVLFASQNGGLVTNGDVLNIANAFLEIVESSSLHGAAEVTVGPGQEVNQIDFGNYQVQPLSGDYNRDGSVDAADHVVWRKFMGTPVTPAYAGADGDGSANVDEADEAVWTAQFGSTATTDASQVVGTADSPLALAAFGVNEDEGGGDPTIAASTNEQLPIKASSESARQANFFNAIDSKSDGTQPLRRRETTSRTVQHREQLAAALRTWLLQKSDGAEAASEIAENGLCDDDEARHAYFESLATAGDNWREAAQRKLISRSKVRSAALR
jgi:hypothetical protein